MSCPILIQGVPTTWPAYGKRLTDHWMGIQRLRSPVTRDHLVQLFDILQSFPDERRSMD